MVMLSAPAVILLGRLPRMESYFSKCASVFGSVRSLTATNSRLGSFSEVRSTLRPNPLMPTLIAMVSPFLSSYECDPRKLPEPVCRQMMLAGQGTAVNDHAPDSEGFGSRHRIRCALCYGKLNSRNASALLKGDVNRAIKYFRLTVCRA